MNELRPLFESSFARSIAVQRESLGHLLPAMTAAAERLIAAFRGGGQAIFFGNGGSAADAQHLAAEFLGRYQRQRAPLPALALHANSSALTTIANDFGYEEAFARLLEALGRPGDVAIGLSTSGNSPNVVAAMRRARQRGLTGIAMTGRDGGQLRDAADILLDVPATETPRIQECHILIGHALCEAVEQTLFAA